MVNVLLIKQLLNLIVVTVTFSCIVEANSTFKIMINVNLNCDDVKVFLTKDNRHLIL